jgi:polyphosphate glucokinase
MELLGIDVGGSGIKGALVSTTDGRLVTDRLRLKTPRAAKPDAVAETVAAIVKNFDWKGPVGCGFPAAIRRGRALTAANISERWLGVDAAALFEQATGCPFLVLNDADAAGLAEMRLGAGKGRDGMVLVITLGTGIGTALFVDGRLVPNTELGHIEIKGREAEKWAAESVRDAENLSWKKWASRLDRYVKTMQAYFWFDLVIVGGGVSKKHEKFLPLLTVDVEIVPAVLRNEAGIVGAALAAEEQLA